MQLICTLDTSCNLTLWIPQASLNPAIVEVLTVKKEHMLERELCTHTWDLSKLSTMTPFVKWEHARYLTPRKQRKGKFFSEVHTLVQVMK